MTFTSRSRTDFVESPIVRAPNRHLFNDSRLAARFSKIRNDLSKRGSIVGNQFCSTQSSVKAYYRFMKNESVSLGEMVEKICQIPKELQLGKTILNISDSTAISLNKHKGRIHDVSKVGVLEDNKTSGFFAHVNIAVDADSGAVLGLTDVMMNHRFKSKEGKGRKVRRDFDPEKMGSIKWAKGARNASQVLSSAKKVIHVCDREADAYLFMDSILSRKENFVIRSQHNRVIQCLIGNEQKKEKLKSCIEDVEPLGELEFLLKSTSYASRDRSTRSKKQIKRPKRIVNLEIRSRQVTALVPANKRAYAESQQLTLWLVQAKEVDYDSSVKDPILWELLTDMPCNNFESACSVINIYRSRWNCEQFFRTTKKKGFRVEDTELETIEAIEKQTLLAFEAAVKVMQLTYARDNTDSFPISVVFNKNEQELLYALNQSYEGKTEKQKNPYPKQQASYAAWIIARMGGWKGYASQRPPGPITMKRGLDIFNNFMAVKSLLNI